MQRFFPAFLVSACSVLSLQTQVAKAADVSVSVPHAHKNLTVFFLEGSEAAPDDYVLLQEALAAKTAKVIETQDVNRLVVANKGKAPVFIHAGDIVKGGQQDRTVSMDVVVLPGTRKRIEVFCVESGRWHRRGQEAVGEFGSSTRMLSSRGQKLAAKVSKQQGDVWQSVQADQGRLEKSLGKTVKARASESSLQLTLENKDLDSAADAYVAAINAALGQHPNAVGYAFSVNGKINAAEIYGSRTLFRRLWPKLLRSSAVEAVGEGATTAGSASPNGAAVQAFLDEANAVQPTVQADEQTVRTLRQEGKDVIMFHTNDKRLNNAAVHRSYLKKGIAINQAAPSSLP